MSQDNKSQRPDDKGELARIRACVRDLALMVLPASLRRQCACGAIANRQLTCVKGAEPDPKAINLCADCTTPEGYSVVGRSELAPADAETVSLANKIFRATR